MKRILYIALCTLLLASCGKKEVYLFTSFNEPATDGLRLLYSEDGLKWTAFGCTFLSPAVGSGVMRDPSIARGGDGVFHAVWTSGWRGDKGFGYACSKNLTEWSSQRYVEVMAGEPEAVNVWAPELFYDDEADSFIIVWATTIPFRFEKGIEEENNNHRLYYATTKDFVTFSEAQLFLDPGFSVIDAVIVKRAKNDYVLVMKDNTRPNRNLRVAFAASPLGPYGAASETFTTQFTEGPSVVKLGSSYYIYYDAYRDHAYGAVKTCDFGTFTDAAAEISVPKGHKHGAIFKAEKAIVAQLEAFCAERQAENKPIAE
ncbi:MAG: glycoside hydrolase family 43 protein [Prevotellaceae bacterium]|jgi:hypothetical protein|nr:glycoside hydrolase family 43 protein [Prevotellaceae bacterium]